MRIARAQMRRRMSFVRTELERWGETGHRATFWWRDDDACASRSELDRLLNLVRRLGIPLCLSVIPAATQVDLLADLSKRTRVRVLQHGWAHANHEAGGNPPCEHGEARPLEQVLKEIAEGLHRLRLLFGLSRVVPVLVPPWNEIPSRVAERLWAAGIRGISMLGPRSPMLAELHIATINADIDIIDWQPAPRFVGMDEALWQVVGQLRMRRLGMTDRDEPIGILTHHWANDGACWEWLACLGETINAHPWARWIMPDWY